MLAASSYRAWVTPTVLSEVVETTSTATISIAAVAASQRAVLSVHEVYSSSDIRVMNRYPFFGMVSMIRCGRVSPKTLRICVTHRVSAMS